MRDHVRSCSAFVICGLLALAACKSGGSTADDDDGDRDAGAGQATGGASGAGGGPGTAPRADASGGGANQTGGTGGSVATDGPPPAPDAGSGSTDAGVPRLDAGRDVAASAGGDAAPASCGGALFCENFDDYPAVTAIADRQRFGPWQAALKSGTQMRLDGTRKVSGSHSLHIHLDGGVSAGGRLFASGSTRPLFAARPTHVYGRMMMYIDPSGTSVHWTFFGVSGPAEPGSPVAGRNAQYIMSSLPRSGVNTYSFVYGLSAPEGYRDCYAQSSTAMPVARWTCVSFEMDSVTCKLRMYRDGATSPLLSVDDRGRGCVAPTPGSTPWYGPVVSQLFVGAWSFHPMNGPLDVWIDDLVVDTKPVPCPRP